MFLVKLYDLSMLDVFDNPKTALSNFLGSLLDGDLRTAIPQQGKKITKMQRRLCIFCNISYHCHNGFYQH
jgi:hypothetical protein